MAFGNNVVKNTWPIGSVSQLGEYIVQLEKKYDNERVFWVICYW